jgi:hypothetical protein
MYSQLLTPPLFIPRIPLTSAFLRILQRHAHDHNGRERRGQELRAARDGRALAARARLGLRESPERGFVLPAAATLHDARHAQGSGGC